MGNEERVRQALRRWRDQEPEAVSLGPGMGTLWTAMTEAMDAACAAAVAEEREACAQVADADGCWEYKCNRRLPAAIRARGEA